MANHSRHVLHHVRDQINKDPERFSTNVYTRMFAIDPDLRDLFPALMSEQRDAFFGVIDHVLDVIPREEGHAELVEFLAQLGRDHRKYGVLPQHYEVIFRALLAEFAVAMDGYWDEDVEQTVAQAMMLTTGVMRGAAETAGMPALWQARVVEKYRITRDLAVIRLETDAKLRHTAGQYLEVHIPQRPKEWRHLSPSIPPNADGELEFHVRAVPGGIVSSAIVAETRPGDVWHFAQPHGTLHIEPDREVLMIAGGTGLAPLRALIIEMSQRADAPRTHIFYGVRYPGELYDLAVLRRIATTNPWLTITAVSEKDADPWWINSVASPESLGIDHRFGTLLDIVLNSGPWFDHQVLIAGSPDMIENTQRALVISGVRASRIQHDPVD